MFAQRRPSCLIPPIGPKIRWDPFWNRAYRSIGGWRCGRRLRAYTCYHQRCDQSDDHGDCCWFYGVHISRVAQGPNANHDAYNLVNAVVSYAMGIPLKDVHNEEVFARVSNLMDRHYSQAFGFPAPTINVLAAVKLDFE